MTKTLIPKHYSPTREEVLKALGAVSETEYNKMWRSLDEKTKDINELVQKMHILEIRLEIATKALEYYAQCKHLNLDILVMLLDKHKNEFADFEVYEDGEHAREALKEMEGVK